MRHETAERERRMMWCLTQRERAEQNVDVEEEESHYDERESNRHTRRGHTRPLPSTRTRVPQTYTESRRYATACTDWADK